MNLTKRQAEFWCAMLVLLIVVAVAITLVDYGIKSAILEQSNKLRLDIERIRRDGREDKATDTDRADPIARDDSPIHGGILVDNPTGMEAAGSPNGTTPETKTAGKRAQPRRQARDRGIPERNEQVG